MRVLSILNRNQAVARPGLPAESDQTTAGVMIRDALARLNVPCKALSLDAAFSGGPIAADRDSIIIMPPLPINRNGDIEAFFRRNGRASIAWRPGGGQLQMLPRMVEDRLIDVVHLSLDQLAGVFGVYDPNSALRKLALLNPSIVVVATNHQTALGLHGGLIYRQAALRIKGPAVGEGKSEAFFAAWLATWVATRNMPRALLAGHTNGAAVAPSWVLRNNLLNRVQLDGAVRQGFDRQSMNAIRPASRVLAAAVVAAILIGLTVLVTATL